MGKEQLIREALGLPVNAIDYHIGQYLAERYPDKEIVEGGDTFFNVEDFAQSGQCSLTPDPIVYNQVVTRWRGHTLDSASSMYLSMRFGQFIPSKSEETEEDVFEHLKNGWFTVEWQGHTFEILTIRYSDGFHGQIYHYWIIADHKEDARDFIRVVSYWNAEVRGEVLVFSSGRWRKDARLFKSIKGATFDNLILKGEMKETIQRDMQHFFSARETYDRYGIPWKRGILFVGPPGNGKTHAVKAIINAMQQPCLYVKSFRSEHVTDEDNISTVFDRARKSAPCILVLEDLDSLLNAHNRSFFLNELDGFASNAGIVTLATTNHPERLDPAILDRPSRFDRKYPFDLPEQPERLAYIQMWNASLNESLRLSEEGMQKLSELTDGFSYAYLKELFLSAMMRWIGEAEQGTMEPTMVDQIEVLRTQMVSAASMPEPEGEPQIPAPSPRRMIFRSAL